MGKVHKKKLAEYAESEELKKSKGGELPEKSAENASSNESEESDEGENSAAAKKLQNSSNADAADGDEEDDDFQSTHGDEAVENAVVEPEKNGKKPSKRKASDKKAAVAEDSDDEPLVGEDATPPKRGRAKTAKKAAPASKTKAGGRGKGKAKKAKAADDDEDEDEEGEEEYEVKDIVDHKVERGVSYFLIRWKGYTKADDTWEAENTLSCPDLIEKYKQKQAEAKSKKSGSSAKKATPSKGAAKQDPEKEWEVEKIIDYAEEKEGRMFRIRWKGFGSKYDTWEPEKNLYCDDIIKKFMSRMKSQENVSFKELREEPKKTKRLVNQVAPRTNLHNPIGRKSKRSNRKQRVYYGDSDE